MLNRKILIITLLIIVISGINTVVIGQNASAVTFEVKNMKVKKVTGTFSGLSGEVNFNVSNLSGSHFNVCIEASTVDTGSEKRDAHLRKEDFFHIDKFKTICFESISIEKKEDQFIAKGNLTMLETTKEMEIPFSLEENMLHGSIRLNRLDFGLGKDTNNFMVSNEVLITIRYILLEE